MSPRFSRKSINSLVVVKLMEQRAFLMVYLRVLCSQASVQNLRLASIVGTDARVMRVLALSKIPIGKVTELVIVGAKTQITSSSR